MLAMGALTEFPVAQETLPVTVSTEKFQRLMERVDGQRILVIELYPRQSEVE